MANDGISLNLAYSFVSALDSLSPLVILTGCALASAVAGGASLEANTVVLFAATGACAVYVLRGASRQLH